MFFIYVFFTILAFAIMAFIADNYGDKIADKVFSQINKVKDFLND